LLGSSHLGAHQYGIEVHFGSLGFVTFWRFLPIE